ncbi:hypothetical protein BJV82DRAFT_627713, partial [Fennellomyces sp. T-0311]
MRSVVIITLLLFSDGFYEGFWSTATLSLAQEKSGRIPVKQSHHQKVLLFFFACVLLLLIPRNWRTAI